MLQKGEMPRECNGWEGIRMGVVTSSQFALRRGAALLADDEYSALHGSDLETLRASGRKTSPGRPNAQPPPEPTSRPRAGRGRGRDLPRGGAIGYY